MFYMKFRHLILFLFFFTTLIHSSSNNLYLELFGPGVWGSINYERNVKENLYIRAGVGFPIKIEESSLEVNSKLEISPIIIGANYLRGNKFKFDVGAGLGLWFMDFEGSTSLDLGDLDINSSGTFPLLFATLGLRYQNPNVRLNFKSGLSFIMINIDDSPGYLPSLYIGSGFQF